MENINPKIGDLRVWHIPQVPGKPFFVPVESPGEAAKILAVLAEYDAFQYEHNIKPDYSNAAGLEVLEEPIEGDDGWHEWYDEDGFDIDEWAEEHAPDEAGPA